MRWTSSNILTLIRLLAAPALVLALVVLPRPWADWVALVLFVGASLTDYVDGYLARAWNETTKMGAMLDPIADKAMVLTALLALVALFGLSAWVLLPAGLIVFREVFVSGLREYLGDVAGTLKVTQLAKWKTTIQMVAIAVLFAVAIVPPLASLLWVLGVALLWVAAVLTVLTGADYMKKALPYLKEDA